MEDNLSLSELLAIVESIRKKDRNDKKFLAAMQGVDLDEEQEENDITDLNSRGIASQEGFGINEGLGFLELGVDE